MIETRFDVPFIADLALREYRVAVHWLRGLDRARVRASFPALDRVYCWAT